MLLMYKIEIQCYTTSYQVHQIKNDISSAKKYVQMVKNTWTYLLLHLFDYSTNYI